MTRKPPSRSPRDEHESGRADGHPDLHAAGHQAITPGASAAPSEGQSSEEGMYQVGYGRPPLQSRFKPGQSGNPKGRPRQSRNMRTIVKQVLSEDMQIREGGRLRRMSAMEALVRTLRARAFKGGSQIACIADPPGTAEWFDRERRSYRGPASWSGIRRDHRGLPRSQWHRECRKR